MKKIAYNKENIIKTMTYVEALEKGLIDYEDIDDFIDYWHESDKKFEHLYDFLGMNIDQYKIYVEKNEKGLKEIFHKGSKK